jgi:putative tricarboxylic transport membrane protein
MTTSFSTADKINIAVGGVTLAIAASFWIQRRYTTEFGGTWADPIILVFGALGLALVVLGVLRKPVGGADEGEEESIPVRGLVTAGVLLVAWVAALPYLGYVITSALFFLLTALSMRRKRPGILGILLDVVIAAVIVGAVYLIFTEVLYVRLPGLRF